MENRLMAVIQEAGKMEFMEGIINCNEITERFGLSLTRADAEKLLEIRQSALKSFGRIEFGRGVTEKIIKEFCDSPYISQQNFAEITGELIEIFYLYKNESLDKLSDDELLGLMREYFEQECMGDLEVLRDSSLDKIARNIRGGNEEWEEGVRPEGWEGCLEYYYENMEE